VPIMKFSDSAYAYLHQNDPVSTLRYKVGIISDVHSGYSNFEAHFSGALNTLHELGVEQIVSCGDSTVHGTVAQWEEYVRVIEASPYGRDQIHEVNGNHDSTDSALTNFKKYSNNGSRLNQTPYFSLDLYGDHYIFMSMDNSVSADTGDCFSSAQMQWLENELETHYGKGYNVFIVEHALFQGWGAGDRLVKPGYKKGLNLSKPSHAKLKELLIQHPDCIMVHGHSHIRLEDRDTHDVVIYAPPGENGGGCHQFHVPAVNALKSFKNDTDLEWPWTLGRSQCWYVEVYTDKIVFQGLNAYTGAAIDGMTYTIQL